MGTALKPNSRAKIVLNDNGSLLSDTLGVCNKINKFFANVAQTLTSKLPACSNLYSVTSNKFKNFYEGKATIGEFTLREVDVEFIFDELSKLNVNKAVGLDDIGPRFLKDGAEQLAPIVAHIVNLSINSKTVPDDMKLAKVITLSLHRNRPELYISHIV